MTTCSTLLALSTVARTVYCAAALGLSGCADAQAAAPAGTPPVDGALELSTVELRDPGTNDMVSHRVLVPKGWETSGGVTWTPQQTRAYVHLEVSIDAPDGRGVRYLPNGSFAFTEGSTAQGQQAQPGQLVGGQIWMAPAGSAAEFVASSLLPFARPEARDVEVLSVREVDELAREWRQAFAPVIASQEQTNQMNAQMGSGSQVKTELSAPLIRVAYTEGGKRYEEEFSMVYLVTCMSYDLGWGGWMRCWDWAIYHTQSVRAEAGRLDAEMPLLRTVAGSVRPTQRWQAMMDQLNAQLQRQQRQSQQVTMREIQKTSRTIAENGNDILEMGHESWKRQQASSDRISHAWSNTTHGVDDYQLPDGTTRSLDSSYNHVFTNSTGDFLFTDDANFEPNVHSTQNWDRVEPLQPMGGAANR